MIWKKSRTTATVTEAVTVRATTAQTVSTRNENWKRSKMTTTHTHTHARTNFVYWEKEVTTKTQLEMFRDGVRARTMERIHGVGWKFLFFIYLFFLFSFGPDGSLHSGRFHIRCPLSVFVWVYVRVFFSFILHIARCCYVDAECMACTCELA